MRIVGLFVLASCMSCALAPRMRAPMNPSQSSGIEIGGGAAAILDAGLNPGGGSTVWIQASLTEQLELFASAATMLRAEDLAYGGHHLDAHLGLRLRQPILHDTLVAIEGAVGYEQRDFDPREIRSVLSFVGRGPVAQQFPGVPIWIYAAPAMALSFNLFDNPGGLPISAYTECPLGLMWAPDPQLGVYVEGGLWSIRGGGYVALGAAYRF